MKRRTAIFLCIALLLLLASCRADGETPSHSPAESTEYPEGYSPVSANLKYAPWWWISTLEEGAELSAETMPEQWRYDEPEAYQLAKAICDYSPMFRFWVEYDSLEEAPDWYLLLTALDHAPTWDFGYVDRLEDQELREFLKKTAEENKYTEGSTELPEEYLEKINENRGYAFEKDVRASFEKLYGEKRTYRAMDVESPDGVPGVYPRLYRYFEDQEVYFRGSPYKNTRCWYPQILSYSETEGGWQAEVLSLEIYVIYEKGLLMPPPEIPDPITDEDIDQLAAEYPVQRYTFEKLEDGRLAVTGIENVNFRVEVVDGGAYNPVVDVIE